MPITEKQDEGVYVDTNDSCGIIDPIQCKSHRNLTYLTQLQSPKHINEGRPY
jgi:hypothetical protein